MKLTKYLKTVPVLVGVALVALGLVAIIAPRTVVKVLPLLLGLVVLILGLYELFTGFDKSAGLNLLGMPRFLQGVINIAVGAVLVFNRSLSVMFLGVVLGLWGIISGGISLRTAFAWRKKGARASLWDGFLKIVIGVVMLAFPFGGMAAWAAVLGWFSLFAGISVLISAYFFHRYMDGNGPFLP